MSDPSPRDESSSEESSTVRHGRTEGPGRPGRPGKGVALVDGVEGSELARERLRAILASIAGAMTIEEACAALSVSPSRFHALREQFLADAVILLEPRRPGPAPKTAMEVEAQAELDRLRRENESLRFEATASKVREELAIAMPGRYGSSAVGTEGATPHRFKKRKPRNPRKPRKPPRSR